MIEPSSSGRGAPLSGWSCVVSRRVSSSFCSRKGLDSAVRRAQQHARLWLFFREEPCVWAVCESIVPFHDVNRQSVALSSENARLWLPSSFSRMRGARVVWWLTAWRPLVEALRARSLKRRRSSLPAWWSAKSSCNASSRVRARAACRSIDFVERAACVRSFRSSLLAFFPHGEKGSMRGLLHLRKSVRASPLVARAHLLDRSRARSVCGSQRPSQEEGRRGSPHGARVA
jgi:hypothetical protein